MTKKESNKSPRNSYKGKLITGEETPFAIKESFKSLRTNLMYTAKNEKCPVFVVTSANAHAGKSVVISNTAISYAMLGKKVLLLDGDMRRPVIHRIFGKIDNTNGLSGLLTENNESGDAFKNYIVSSSVENLDLIPAGHVPPNPTELLASNKIRNVLEEAKKTYDYIFLDLPPIGEVADAGVLSDCATGYIFVIRAGDTDSRAVEASLEKLSRVNARISGFVLNDIDPKSEGKYGYKYKNKYRYGYAYGSKKQDNE